jgi:hypothetical protein
MVVVDNLAPLGWLKCKQNVTNEALLHFCESSESSSNFPDVPLACEDGLPAESYQVLFYFFSPYKYPVKTRD